MSGYWFNVATYYLSVFSIAETLLTMSNIHIYPLLKQRFLSKYLKDMVCVYDTYSLIHSGARIRQEQTARQMANKLVRLQCAFQMIQCRTVLRTCLTRLKSSIPDHWTIGDIRDLTNCSSTICPAPPTLALWCKSLLDRWRFQSGSTLLCQLHNSVFLFRNISGRRGRRYFCQKSPLGSLPTCSGGALSIISRYLSLPDDFIDAVTSCAI